MSIRPVLGLSAAICMLALLVIACAHQQGRANPAELITPIPAYGAAPLVRVKLSAPSTRDSTVVKFTEGSVRIDSEIFPGSGEVTLRAAGGKVIAEGVGQGSYIEVTPSVQPAHFSIDGRTYRGTLRAHATPEGWEIVNLVDLEQYVAGVIGWEMIAGWPVEALKAQAVASRSYAVFVMEENRGSGRNWDMDDTTQYQVYGGVGPTDQPKLWRESVNVLAARSQTTGQVMTYQGKGFKAFFHSTSGGHTVDPRVGLGTATSIAPLSGVETGEFGKDSPKHNWRISLPSHEVTARLMERRLAQTAPIRMERAETAPSGHAMTVRIYGPTGHFTLVDAIEFRRALGLPSTRFNATRNADEWVFEGKGFGHGCGMCQWSARGMALQGWDALRILKTMYPGSDLRTLY